MGVLAVFLVGFMGSGKSSVGQELARRLNWNFVDLDQRIEAREQKSISEIFRQSAESGFRRAETAALHDLIESLQQDTVIALGGGAFGQPANLKLIGAWPSVFLDATVDELWHRSSEGDATRPLRQNREQFAELYQQRLPAYRRATVTVETSNREISSICAEIEGKLNLREWGRNSASVPDLANFQPGGSQ